MTKVAIVGGGVAGLTCAYYLSAKGVGLKLFEKENLLGGRAAYSLGVMVESKDKNSMELIQELDLNSEKKRISMEKFGLWAQGKPNPMSEFQPAMQKILSPEELSILGEIQRYIGGLSFPYNPDEESEEVKKLREMSMQEWIEPYPPPLKMMLFDPILRLVFESDYKKFSAAQGVNELKRFMEGMAMGDLCLLEEGPFAITREVSRKLRERNQDILFSAEIIAVEESKNGFEVTYKEGGEEKTESAEYVVLAIPLNVTDKILDLSFDVDYSTTECIILKGELKYDYQALIGADPGSPLRVLFIPGREHYAYPMEVGQEIDLSQFYEKWTILGRKKLDSAMPLIPPGASTPSIKTEMENLYLCGDFYSWPCLDTAIFTGRKVAELIE